MGDHLSLPVAAQETLKHQLHTILSDFIVKQVNNLLPDILHLIQTPMILDAQEQIMGTHKILPPRVIPQRESFPAALNNSVETGKVTSAPMLDQHNSPLQKGLSFCQVLMPTIYSHDDTSDMLPQRKGEFLSVKIDDALVRKGVSQLQHTLIGKLSLVPGDSPYTLENLKMKLGQLWGVVGAWHLIPLGQSYYNIQLPSLEDTGKNLDKRTWNLKPGVLRVQKWIRGFNP